MTTEEKIQLAKALQVKAKSNAKHNYYDYVKYTHDDYEYNRHGEYISNVIDEAIKIRDKMLRNEIKQSNQYIALSVPPRHGKSMHISETLPSYFMGYYPKSKVIVTAYSSTLADDFARSNAKKVEEYNVFDCKVLANNQDRMILDNESVCVKAGILGGITGKGAHLLLIDDPIKTAEEARSEVHREKVWKEWQSSLSTRLEQCAIVIVIMTRWHEDDLVGRLLNNEYGVPLPWKVINLPLEAEENDILGRNIGEPLWPERYGYDFIEERKSYPESFNALYQGRPVSQEGNIVKRHWFQYYDHTHDFVKRMNLVIMSVDATFKDTSKSDKVAIQIWGKKNANYYLIDRVSERLDFIATIQAIKNMLKKYPMISMKLIEDKANGSAIISVLNREIGGFIGINPQGSKEARLHSVLPFIESGNTYLPRLAWTNEYVEELAAFPNGAHDDDVDSTSQALSRLINANAMDVVVEEDDPMFRKKTVVDVYGSGKGANKLAKWG